MADLTGVNPDLANRITQLEQAVASAGGTIGIESGFRTNAQQAALYASEPGLAAPPGHSNHEKGLAVDLNGNLNLAHQLAAKFGLVFPMSWEPWHIEMAGSSTPTSVTTQPANTPSTPAAGTQDPVDRSIAVLMHALKGGTINDPFNPTSPNTPDATTTTPATPAATTSVNQGLTLGPGGMASFSAALLGRLGAPVTDENLRFLEAWQRAEGGSADNPMNTTENAPGATIFNSVGVKRYPSVQEGVDATYRTLINGNYGGIIAALKAGNDAVAAARAVAASPWGTGSGVLNVLGAK